MTQQKKYYSQTTLSEVLETLDGGMWDDEVNFDFYKGEMRRYYANIVGKYGVQVTNAIKKTWRT